MTALDHTLTNGEFVGRYGMARSARCIVALAADPDTSDLLRRLVEGRWGSSVTGWPHFVGSFDEYARYLYEIALRHLHDKQDVIGRYETGPWTERLCALIDANPPTASPLSVDVVDAMTKVVKSVDLVIVHGPWRHHPVIDILCQGKRQA